MEYQDEARQTIRDEATVDYAMSQHGFLTPASVFHRHLVNGGVMTENLYRYDPFKLLQTTSTIQFGTCAGLHACSRNQKMTPIVYLHGSPLGPAPPRRVFSAGFWKRRAQRSKFPTWRTGILSISTISGQLAVLDRIADGRAVSLMGSSMGGYLAALYAARHPQVSAWYCWLRRLALRNVGRKGSERRKWKHGAGKAPSKSSTMRTIGPVK